MTWSFLVFLALATQIAAIGALLDQPILIIGAMVLGPEFGPVAAMCFGVLQRDLRSSGGPCVRWCRIRGGHRDHPGLRGGQPAVRLDRAG